MATCEWCGKDHDIQKLCKANTVGLSRRRFLFLSAAAVGAAALAPAFPGLPEKVPAIVVPGGAMRAIPRVAWQHITWNGAVWIPDRDAPSGQVFGLMRRQSRNWVLGPGEFVGQKVSIARPELEER